MSETITGLRTELFDTLRALRAGKIDIDHARAVSDLAQTIINTAKVEVDYARATGKETTAGFLPMAPTDDRPRIGETRRTATGEVTTTPTGAVHRIK